MFSHLLNLPRGRTQLLDLATRTVRLSRKTTPPPVPDEPVAEQRPLVLRHELHQVLFDFFRVRVPGQAKPAGQPRDMCVHHNPDIQVECVSQHDVRGLAPHAVEAREFLHRARQLAAVKHAWRFFALLRKKPVVLTACSSSARSAFA